MTAEAEARVWAQTTPATHETSVQLKAGVNCVRIFFACKIVRNSVRRTHSKVTYNLCVQLTFSASIFPSSSALGCRDQACGSARPGARGARREPGGVRGTGSPRRDLLRRGPRNSTEAIERYSRPHSLFSRKVLDKWEHCKAFEFFSFQVQL